MIAGGNDRRAGCVAAFGSPQNLAGFRVVGHELSFALRGMAKECPRAMTGELMYIAISGVCHDSVAAQVVADFATLSRRVP